MLSIKIYLVFHAFEPIVVAPLPRRLRYPQTMSSKRINLLFRWQKTLTSQYFLHVGIKRSQAVPS